MQTLNAQHATMNGAPEPQTAARASPLVGPYPIDEDALRRLKRLHDGGVIDDYTFRCRKAEALGLTRKAARTRLRLSLLHLPADVLSKIASHAVVPALVVAAGKDLEARTALRKGTDAAERSRYGGVGLTVREAEQILRTTYRAPDANLASRRAAGRTLGLVTSLAARNDGFVKLGGGKFFVGFELVSPLVAYGADLDASIRPDGIHALHSLAVYAPGEAMKLARLLLAAGRDIDPECDIGTTPLCWCLTAGQLTKAHYQLATFLIENGCDVLKAHRGWNRALDVHGARGQQGPMLLDILCQQPRTTTNLRFTQYFGGKLAFAAIMINLRARARMLV